MNVRSEFSYKFVVLSQFGGGVKVDFSKNRKVDRGGEWSWKFRFCSKTLKIDSTGLYLIKNPKIIKIRSRTTKISSPKVGGFSRKSRIFVLRFAKTRWYLSLSVYICLKSEKWENVVSNWSYSNVCAIAIKNQILLHYNKLHLGKFLFFRYLGC